MSSMEVDPVDEAIDEGIKSDTDSPDQSKVVRRNFNAFVQLYVNHYLHDLDFATSCTAIVTTSRDIVRYISSFTNSNTGNTSR